MRPMGGDGRDPSDSGSLLTFHQWVGGLGTLASGWGKRVGYVLRLPKECGQQHLPCPST